MKKLKHIKLFESFSLNEEFYSYSPIRDSLRDILMDINDPISIDLLSKETAELIHNHPRIEHVDSSKNNPNRFEVGMIRDVNDVRLTDMEISRFIKKLYGDKYNDEEIEDFVYRFKQYHTSDEEYFDDLDRKFGKFYGEDRTKMRRQKF